MCSLTNPFPAEREDIAWLSAQLVDEPCLLLVA
jgi:hypothetical protein